MLGQVGKYSEIINNSQRKYILCAEISILCAETFSTPENIFFSPPKKIKCPNIFSPLPRFTFGSPFILKSARKHFADPRKSFVFPRKIYTPLNFLSHAQFFLKKICADFFFPCRDAVWCRIWVNDPSWHHRHCFGTLSGVSTVQRCVCHFVHQVVQCPTWWHTYEYLTGEDQTRTLARRL